MATCHDVFQLNQGLYGCSNLVTTGWEKLPATSRSALSANALKDLSTFPADWPETEMVVGALAVPGAPGANYAVLFAVLAAPLSRGYVTLASPDTSNLPIVNPNYLSSTTDQEVAVQLFRRLRVLLQSPAFAPILVGEEVPGHDVQTDAEILAWLKASMSPSYHASCTCKS